jgi:hypothetical protein
LGYNLAKYLEFECMHTAADKKDKSKEASFLIIHAMY